MLARLCLLIVPYTHLGRDPARDDISVLPLVDAARGVVAIDVYSAEHGDSESRDKIVLGSYASDEVEFVVPPDEAQWGGLVEALANRLQEEIDKVYSDVEFQEIVASDGSSVKMSVDDLQTFLNLDEATRNLVARLVSEPSDMDWKRLRRRADGELMEEWINKLSEADEMTRDNGD